MDIANEGYAVYQFKLGVYNGSYVTYGRLVTR
jgi:hypothetical protein